MRAGYVLGGVSLVASTVVVCMAVANQNIALGLYGLLCQVGSVFVIARERAKERKR